MSGISTVISQRRHFLAGVCALGVALSLGHTAAVHAAPVTGQIGSFESFEGDYFYSAGVLSGTTEGSFTFDPFAVTHFDAPDETFSDATLTIEATATTAATQIAGTLYQQLFDGVITILADDGVTVLLRTVFEGAEILGRLGDITVALTGSTETIGTSISYTSDVAEVETRAVPPAAFRFSLNPIAPALALNGDNFRDFSGPDAANFSASVVVPEPSTVLMAFAGLPLLGLVVYRNRRRVSQS